MNPSTRRRREKERLISHGYKNFCGMPRLMGDVLEVYPNYRVWRG